ncbi:hypothetical protein [Marinobacter sediminum]|uniref:hypothetical protein n=1 Tax=Marinobacter sediminum TaxID=256323 RepID=UPI00193ABAA5|nr:hypothetical protein [Marinobacter sediminum]
MKTSVISLAVVASILTACGGGSGNSASNTVPRERVNTEPKDVVEAVARGAARFDGAAPAVDDLGSYQISGPIDYRYAPMEVTSRIDDGGRRTETFEVDVAGVIHFPALPDGAVAPEAGFPVILFQHGRHSTCSTTGNENGSESSGTDCQADGLEPIRSDKGYDYIAENMASHGYVVLSVDANDINAQDGGSSNDAGITARAELLLHHLDIVRDIANNPDSAFRFDQHGSDFSALFGVTDINRVGLMGHSRGGNAVAKAVSYNRDFAINNRNNGEDSFTRIHDIRGVFSLAPTDFDQEAPTNTAWVTLSPYCDGDVANPHGIYMYDNLRYNPDNVDGAQFMITSIGANHNYYNSFWFNDDATLNGFDPYCSEASPLEGRYAREDQERHGEFLIASFLRLFVGGETQFAGYWGGKERLPESACPIGVETCDELIHLSFQQPKDSIIIVDDTLDASSLEQNNLENANSSGATDVLFWCSPSFGGGLDSRDDLADGNLDRCISPATISGAPQISLGYLGASANVSFVLSETGLDVSEMDFFSLRVGVSTTPDNLLGQDFTLVLSDANGTSVSLLASDYSDALYAPPGLPVSARDTGGKTINNMVPFRLDALPIFDSELDLTSLVRAELRFDQLPAGSLQFTDVMFQKVEF